MTIRISKNPNLRTLDGMEIHISTYNATRVTECLKLENRTV